MNNNENGNDVEGIEEAFKSLSLYPNAILDDLLEKYDFRRPRIRAEKISAIQEGVQNKIVLQETFMEDLDNLRFNGRQHIFLYRLKRGSEARRYLRSLRKEGFVRACLDKVGCIDRYNKNHLKWKAKVPYLVEVKYIDEQNPRFLIFKWIETRLWGRDEKTTERSVNFFRLDLRGGYAEFRIQRLQPYPQKSLHKEIEIYRKKISEIIDFHHFSAIPLAPIIGRLLNVKFFIGVKMKISNWEIRLPDGGSLVGRKDPKLFIKLKLPYKSFFGRQIRCVWKFHERQWGPLWALSEMRSETGEVTSTIPCEEKQINGILRRLRRFSRQAKIKMPELKYLAEINSDLLPVLINVDIHFSQLGDKNITVKHLKENEWLPLNLVKKTFTEMERQYKELFSFINKKEMLIYTPPDDPGGLLGILVLKKGPLGQILSRMEKRLGRGKYGKSLLIAVVLLLIIAYAVIVILSAERLMELMKSADKSLLFLIILLIVGIIAVLARLIVGRGPFRWAFKMLKKLFQL